MHDDLDLRVIERHHDADPLYREQLRQRVAAVLDGSEAQSAEATAPGLILIDLAPQTMVRPERHRRRWVASAVALVGAAAVVVALVTLPSSDEPLTPADQSPPPTNSSVDETGPADTVPADDLPASTTGTAELFTELIPGAMIDLPAAPIGGRRHGGAVWTGTEMVVWGGFDDDGQRSGDGAAFNLANGTWRVIAAAPIADRSEPAVVWTGTEMIVWGGSIGDDTSVDDGAAYDPATDTWRLLPTAPITSMDGRLTSMVWTGDEAILVNAAAAAYDPVKNSWRRLAEPPFVGYPAAFAGDSIIVCDGTLLGRYDVAADSWSMKNVASQAAFVVAPDPEGWTYVIALPSATGAPVQIIDSRGNGVGEMPAFPGDPGVFGERVGASGWWAGDEVIFWVWAGEFPHEPEQMWALNLTTREWRQLDDAPMIEPEVVIAGDVLLAWGGSGPRGAPPDQTGVVYRTGTAPAD